MGIRFLQGFFRTALFSDEDGDTVSFVRPCHRIVTPDWPLQKSLSEKRLRHFTYQLLLRSSLDSVLISDHYRRNDYDTNPGMNRQYFIYHV